MPPLRGSCAHGEWRHRAFLTGRGPGRVGSVTSSGPSLPGGMGRACGVRGVGRVGCGVLGPVGAVLHIRSGPANGGSLESCGNAPALNVVEILPCAERAPLHMGACPLKTNILERTPESCGKPGIDPCGRTLSNVQHPRNRPEGIPHRPGGARWEAGPARIPQEAAPPHQSPAPRRRSGEKDSMSLSYQKGLGGGVGHLLRPPRRDVHFALENNGWSYAFECEAHVWAPETSGGAGRVGAAARGIAGVLVTAAAPGEGAWRRRLVQICCKDPGRAESVREETLVFRASSRGRSRPGAPLQQIWTRPHLKTVPGAPPAPLRVSPSAWCHRWRRGTPAQRFRGSAGGPPNCEGYSEVVLKAWGVKVVVTVCSGGSSSSKGLLRRRPSASPGCDARGR